MEIKKNEKFKGLKRIIEQEKELNYIIESAKKEADKIMQKAKTQMQERWHLFEKELEEKKEKWYQEGIREIQREKELLLEQGKKKLERLKKNFENRKKEGIEILLSSLIPEYQKLKE